MRAWPGVRVLSTAPPSTDQKQQQQQNEASYLPSDADVHGGVVVFVQRHSCVSDTVQQQRPVKNRAQHLSTVSGQRLGAASER